MFDTLGHRPTPSPCNGALQLRLLRPRFDSCDGHIVAGPRVIEFSRTQSTMQHYQWPPLSAALQQMPDLRVPREFGSSSIDCVIPLWFGDIGSASSLQHLRLRHITNALEVFRVVSSRLATAT